MLVELGRLQVTIRVGNIQTNRSPLFAIRSSRFVPTTKAMVRLWDVNFDLLKTIKRGDVASIKLGYVNQQQVTWKFEVTSIHEIKRNTLDVQLVQEDVQLKRKLIKRNWENEPPAPIVRNIVETAGFTSGHIENIPVSLPKFIASSKSAWDTVKYLERCLRLSHGTSIKHLALWQDTKGTYHWNARFEKSNPSRVLAIGNGLLKHYINNKISSMDKGENADIPLNSLETFLAPELKHSQTIRIKDPRRGVEGEFPIIDVEHRFVNDSVGTYINYLPEPIS